VEKPHHRSRGNKTFSGAAQCGRKDSEILKKEYTVDYSTTLGTEPSNVTVEEETSVTLPTLTAAGYEIWRLSAIPISYLRGHWRRELTPTDNITLMQSGRPSKARLTSPLEKDSDAWTGQSLALYQGLL
jgi:hypothetical protein